MRSFHSFSRAAILGGSLIASATVRAQDATETACREHLEVLGAAYGRFLVMTEGKPPARLSDFYTQGIVLDLDTFTCPAASDRITDGKQIDERTSYEVTTTLDDKLPMLLFKEKHGHHGGQALAFYSDRTFKKINAPAPPAPTAKTNSPPAVETNAPIIANLKTNPVAPVVTNADGNVTLTLTNRSEQVLALDRVGKEHYAKGRWAEAEATFRLAIKLDPTNGWHHYNLGLALGQQARWKDSEASLREALRVFPAFAPAHVTLGHALGFQNRWPEAQAAYVEAVRLAPEEASYRSHLAIAFRSQLNWPAAADAFGEAVRLSPTNSQYQLDLGSAFAYQGKWNEAEAPYREASRLDPNSAWAHGGLGHVFMARSQFAEAEAAYRAAIRLSKGIGQFHADLAGTLLRQNRTDDARAEAREAIRLGYKEHWSYRELGLSP